MKKIHTTIAALFLFLLLSSQCIASEKAIIAGNVENPVESEISIYQYNYYDLSGSGSLIGKTEIAENGSFVLYFDCDKAVKLKFRTGPYTLIDPLYVFPGDSIFIKMKFTETSLIYNYEGNGKSLIANKAYKTYIGQYVNTETTSVELKNLVENDSLDKVFGYLDSMKENQSKYYHQIKDSDNIPDMVKEDIKFSIDYAWASAGLGAMMTQAEKFFMANNKIMDTQSYYNKIESAVTLNVPEAKSNSAYLNYVYSTLSYYFFNWVFEQQALNKAFDSFENQKKIFSIAENNFEGISKDIAKAKIFRDFAPEITSKEILDYFMKELEKFEENAEDKKYAEETRYFLDHNMPIMPGRPAPDFTLTNINGKEVSLSDFKGKFVYIDFWGTWCGPCRKELPHYKALQEKFKGSDDIVFMSVAMERGNIDRWKTFVNTQKLPGVQLYSNSRIHDVGQKYKIRAVPTFMIVDKEGILVNMNAQRPSSPNLEKTLKDIINKK